MLFAPPAWAQRSYQDTDDDTALISQDVDDESDDHGQSFEQELSDIERQYAELVPDTAKITASKEVASGISDTNEE